MVQRGSETSCTICRWLRTCEGETRHEHFLQWVGSQAVWVLGGFCGRWCAIKVWSAEPSTLRPRFQQVYLHRTPACPSGLSACPTLGTDQSRGPRLPLSGEIGKPGPQICRFFFTFFLVALASYCTTSPHRADFSD